MYRKPMILVNDDMAEGVYAASGATCWSGEAPCVQTLAGNTHNIYEIRLVHSPKVEHISNAVTVTLTFSAPVVDAYSENSWDCSVNGNVVTVTRPSHANAYQSGDTVSFKVWAKAADEATTRGLTATITGFSCDYSENVQGRGGDGT